MERVHILSCLSLHCCVSITMSSGFTYGTVLPDSVFLWITPLRTMVLELGKVFLALHHSSSYYGTGTQQNVILSTPMKVFFFLVFFDCEAPSGLRRLSNRWCQGTGLGITDTMAPVPLKASTAPQSAVLAL